LIWQDWLWHKLFGTINGFGALLALELYWLWHHWFQQLWLPSLSWAGLILLGLALAELTALAPTRLTCW